MKQHLVYHHLGLGDHYICNGLVRKLFKDAKAVDPDCKFYVMCKEVYAQNVKQMYKDLDMNFAIIKDDNQARVLMSKFRGKTWDLTGVQHWEWNDPSVFNEHKIYLKAGLKVEDRYEHFKFCRDRDREEEVYREVMKKLNVERPYVFVADDPDRGYVIDPWKAPIHKCSVVKSHNLKEYTVSELLTVAERAESVHVMYSSFMMLFDALEFWPMWVHESYLGKIAPYMDPNHPQHESLMKHYSDRRVAII